MADENTIVALPLTPTKAMLRPFLGCPEEELELAYHAMVAIAQIEMSKRRREVNAQGGGNG